MGVQVNAKKPLHIWFTGHLPVHVPEAVASPDVHNLVSESNEHHVDVTMALIDLANNDRAH